VVAQKGSLHEQGKCKMQTRLGNGDCTLCGRQVFCNRDCILKTFTERGTDYIGQMALQNCRDLEPILWWNYEHGVRLFRCGSSNPVSSARSLLLRCMPVRRVAMNHLHHQRSQTPNLTWRAVVLPSDSSVIC